MGESLGSNHDCLVDDLYFSALFDEEEIFPISDEKYADVLQLQEAIISSLTHLTGSSRYFRIVPLEESVFFDPKGKGKETGGPSSSYCTICMELKPAVEMFCTRACSHLFCIDCTSRYISVKIQDNIANVKCPDLNCRGILDPEICRQIIPGEVFDRWEQALSESVTLGSQKVFCPYKDCSGFMLDDGLSIGEAVTTSECPTCHRLFCAQCSVPWHGGWSCTEFEACRDDGKLDEMAKALAERENWKKCPNCRFYVEKTSGCEHISCRCGFEFCYVCGCRWTGAHSCRR